MKKTEKEMILNETRRRYEEFYEAQIIAARNRPKLAGIGVKKGERIISNVGIVTIARSKWFALVQLRNKIIGEDDYCTTEKCSAMITALYKYFEKGEPISEDF